MDPITLFLLLIGIHYIADYPLQGEFLSKAKNHKNPIPGIPYFEALLAHSAIHGFFVGVITGSLLLAVAETMAHMIIDFLKCNGNIDFITDQNLHITCKLIWVIVFFCCL